MAAMLIVLGTVCMGLRFAGRRGSSVGRGDSVWRLSYDIGFVATKAGASVRVALPADTPGGRVFRRRITHPGLRADIIRGRPSVCEEIVAVAGRRGSYRLEARFDIHVRAAAAWRALPEEGALDPADRADLLRAEALVQVGDSAIQETWRQWKGARLTRDGLLDRIFEHCSTAIAAGDEWAPVDAATALAHATAAPLGRARAMVALCRAAKLPARLVVGFDLQANDKTAPIVWVEVLHGKQWHPHDPENGYAGALPRTYVPVCLGSAAVVRTADVISVRQEYWIAPLRPPRGLNGSEPRRLGDVLDLTRLPLGTQRLLALLLVLPLGALVTALFRNVVGIETFGTFTPALLALSFVYASWETGLATLAVLLTVGIVGRGVLERLRLLLVPRLGIVLTIVVLCLVFGVSLMEHRGTTPLDQAVLLPIVIVTMLIERVYVGVEEDGIGVAVRLLAGTATVAMCCYLLLRSEALGAFLVAYPETHCLTAAMLVLIGRYTGYRLTELWRFRELAPGEPAGK